MVVFRRPVSNGMISVDDRNIWNKEVAHHPSFLQSWQWGDLQQKLGRRVFHFNVSGLFASAIEQKLPLGQIYLYVPHGPVAREEKSDSWADLVNATNNAVDLKSPVFLRIEPLVNEFRGEPIEKILKEANFRQTKPVQPKTTLVINLCKDEKEILEEMEHDTRYSIRAAGKRGVTVDFYAGNDKEKNFDVFWEIFLETNKRHSLKVYSKSYYQEVARMEGDCSSKIALARADGQVVSAAIFVYFGERVFYLFAGSRAGYSKFNAPTYLLWHAILDAKRNGYLYFDLWGISHENKNWERITAFKKSFGGEEITSPGAWDYVFNKPMYFAYNFAKKFI